MILWYEWSNFMYSWCSLPFKNRYREDLHFQKNFANGDSKVVCMILLKYASKSKLHSTFMVFFLWSYISASIPNYINRQVYCLQLQFEKSTPPQIIVHVFQILRTTFLQSLVSGFLFLLFRVNMMFIRRCRTIPC